MVASMTAYARMEDSGDWGGAVWEIRSVNHRYLDLALRLPEELRELETAARERVGRRLRRGRVECGLRFEPPATMPLRFDRALARRVVAAATQIEIDDASRQGQPPAAIDRLEVLRWPGVLKTPPPDMAALREPLLRLLDAALERLVAARRREGETIRALLERRCAACDSQLTILQAALPRVLAAARERFLARGKEAGVEMEAERLEQEALLWCQKTDATEELERLQAHLEETRRTLGQEQPMGRRLDFLMQEMNREAATLGAKSAHPDTGKAAIELRVLIEQMREQIQNLE